MKVIFCHQFGKEVGYAITEESELPIWKRFLKLVYLTGYTLDETKQFWLHLIPKTQGELTIWEFSDKPFNMNDYTQSCYFHMATGSVKDLVVLSLTDLAELVKPKQTIDLRVEEKKLGITIGEPNAPNT